MKLKLHHPERILNDHRQRLVQIQDQMERRIEERLTDRKHRLALLAGRLHGLSPLEQLSRGFGFVTDKDGKPVASVKELQKEESLQIRLADGRVETRILKIEVWNRVTGNWRRKRMAETKTNQEMSIEETLEALEMIIEKMEDRDSSLEETFANYELGMKMVKSCSDQIDRVEKKIQVLAEESRDGEF